MKEKNQRQLAEILGSKPSIRIETSNDDLSIDENETRIRVELPYGCYRKGKVIDYGQGTKWLFGDFTSVPDRFQRNGIGQRLSDSFYEVAKSLGAKRAYVEVGSEGGLRLTAKKYGSDALTFHSFINRESLPEMAYEKALEMGDDIKLGVSFNLD